MEKVAIVTGSNHGIPQSLIEEYGIHMIPFFISLGDETFRDAVDITPGEFLEKVKKSKLYPKTAALPIGELAEAYRKAAKEGRSVVSIHMSSGLSLPTHENAKKAKELVPEADIEIIDSRLTWFPIGLVVLEAAKAAREGKDKAEVAKIAKEVISRTSCVFGLPDLEYLHRGGRIGKAKSLLGALMKVIPIVAIRPEDNIITPVGRGRNIRQVNQRMIEVIRADMERIGAKKIKCMIGDVGDNPEATRDLKGALEQNIDCDEIIEGFTRVEIVHVGPGAWGVGYYLL